MIDWLKEFDYARIMIWVVPGCCIILFRSFALRGQFPAVKKDDVAAFLIGSTLYDFLLSTTIHIEAGASVDFGRGWSSLFWLFVLIVLPVAVGLALGLFEASDATGRAFRRLGISFPAPTPSAWDTLFRKLRPGSVLIVTLKDATVVRGRWTSGARLSSASTDPANLDLFIAEIGTVNARGRYVPKRPQRGLYIAASEIRSIEVI